MITIETAAKKAASSLSASTLLASAYASAVLFFRRWQTYRELSALDDRTLHDIGLDRSMIASVALQAVRTTRDAAPITARAPRHEGLAPSHGFASGSLRWRRPWAAALQTSS